MFLKNYTSNVPVSQTVYRIEQVLIKCGAAGITKEFAGNKGAIDALTFQIETATGKISIRLPVNVEHALDALWKDYVGDDRMTQDGQSVQWGMGSKKKKNKSDFTDQAERTAWKITRDWVEVQMSMIQLKQADVLQVFLPYVITSTGESVYKRVQDGGMKMLLTNGEE